MKRRASPFPKYVHAYRDRHGTLRADFRWRSTNVPLPLPPLGDEWWEAYRATLVNAIAGREPRALSKIGASRTKPGSCSAAFVLYAGSASFKTGLAVSTQRVHFNILRRWCDKYGELRIGHLQRHHVAAWVAERAKVPAAAQVFAKVMRRFIQFCVEVGLCTDNPALGVKPPKYRSKGIYSWSETDIARFEAHHAIGTRPRLAMALALYTAQRRGDLVTMGRQHLRGGTLHVVQQKTGAALAIPVHPALAAIIEATPNDNLTFLVTRDGSPFTTAGFGNHFREWCDAAGLPPECSVHGLRKAACRRLAEAGCSAHEIGAVSGHVTLPMIQHYTKAADQVRLARAAMTKVAT